MIQTPQSFVVSQECHKVARQNGSRRAEGSVFFARVNCPPCEELRCNLDPTEVKGPDHPLVTFRILKEKVIRHHSEYSIRRLVLSAWDRMKANGEFTAMGML